MKQEEKTMGSIILTGLRFGGHSFSLDYPVVDGQMICVAHCECGYEIEIPNFNSYGGGIYTQWIWGKHVGSSNAGDPGGTRPFSKGTRVLPNAK